MGVPRLSVDGLWYVPIHDIGKAGYQIYQDVVQHPVTTRSIQAAYFRHTSVLLTESITFGYYFGLDYPETIT